MLSRINGAAVKRWAIAAIVWLVAAAVLVPVCFFAVLILAGPHSSLLPSAIQPAVLVAGCR